MGSVPEVNLDTYNRGPVVRYYADQTYLQKPEQAILDRLRPRLGAMRMLDLGCGAGRTTLHFAMLVREYVGVDFSEEMIRACRARYPAPPGKGVSFQVGDARDLSAFADGSFDFVLFSFNGIDCIPDEAGRRAALREVRRVLPAGGPFCFSSHNLQFHDGLPRERHPVRFLRQWLRSRRARRQAGGADIAWLAGGEYDGAPLRHAYVRPGWQLRELREAGFADVRVFGLDGAEVSGESLPGRRDGWLHYLCRTC